MEYRYILEIFWSIFHKHLNINIQHIQNCLIKLLGLLLNLQFTLRTL